MDYEYAVELVNERGTVFARCTLRLVRERVGRLVLHDPDAFLMDGEYLMRSGGREIDVTIESMSRPTPGVRIAYLHQDFDPRGGRV